MERRNEGRHTEQSRERMDRYKGNAYGSLELNEGDFVIRQSTLVKTSMDDGDGDGIKQFHTKRNTCRE
jgi:hypothetical protein